MVVPASSWDAVVAAVVSRALGGGRDLYFISSTPIICLYIYIYIFCVNIHDIMIIHDVCHFKPHGSSVEHPWEERN